MVLALAWKFRWAMIKPTNSSEISTLESSKADDRIWPNAPVLAEPTVATPESNDSPQPVLPSGVNPSGF